MKQSNLADLNGRKSAELQLIISRETRIQRLWEKRDLKSPNTIPSVASETLSLIANSFEARALMVGKLRRSLVNLVRLRASFLIIETKQGLVVLLG